MQAYIIVMDAAAVLLLTALAAGLGRAARHALRGAFRAVCVGGAAICLLQAFSSLHHLLIVAAFKHLIARHWLYWLLGPLDAVQATLCVLVGICGAVLALRHWCRVERAQAMVDVLTDRVPSSAGAKQARLSLREQEVLGLIRRGIISDAEIARTLQISPATAATHVQNILRKTRLHNRHDLMLLPHWGTNDVGKSRIRALSPAARPAPCGRAPRLWPSRLRRRAAA